MWKNWIGIDVVTKGKIDDGKSVVVVIVLVVQVAEKEIKSHGGNRKMGREARRLWRVMFELS